MTTSHLQVLPIEERSYLFALCTRESKKPIIVIHEFTGSLEEGDAEESGFYICEDRAAASALLPADFHTIKFNDLEELVEYVAVGIRDFAARVAA